MSRWNREAALLGIPDLPTEAFRHDGDGKIKPQGGGGGGGNTTATQYTSNVPEYAKGEFMDLVGKASALSNAPYQAYTGERTAQFTPLQQQAFGQAGQQQVAGQIGFGTGLAGLAGTSSFTQPGTAGAFMSPFIGQALAPQLRELSRQADIQGTQQQAQATQRGAFGGSRDAIMRAERERNLMQQQGDVLSKGYQTAYEQAAQQYNAEQAQRLQAASALGQLGQQQFGQEMDITKMQTDLGGQQRQAVQDVLNQQYADFQAQKDYPYQQLGFLSDILRGAGGSTRSVYPGPSGISQLAGLGTAAYGLSGLMKEGGEVKGYAVGGGITGSLNDQQLAKEAQRPRSPMMGLAAAQEMGERSQLRAAAPQGLPPEATGIAAIAPDDVAEFADGGIVSFAGGGDPELEALYAARERYLRANADTSGIDQAIAAREAAAEQGGMPWERGLTALKERVSAPRGWEANAEQLMEDTAAPDNGVRVIPGVAGLMEQQGRRGVAPGTKPVFNAGARTLSDGTRLNTDAGAQAPGTTTSIAASAREETRGAGPAGTGIGGLPSAEAYMDQLRKLSGRDAEAAKLRTELGGINATEEANARQAREEFERDVAARGKLGAEREARLKKQEGELEERKTRGGYEALLEAGLAMMAGESPHALVNIGKGAMEGTKAYRKSVADVEAARSKLDEAFATLEDARRAEDIDTAEGRRRYTAAERAAKLQGQRAMFELSKATGLDANMRDAATAFDAAFKAREGALNRASTERAASIRSTTSTKDARALYDKAVDNAQKRLDLLLKTPQGIMMTTEQLDALRRKYVSEEMANMGLELPSGAASAAPAAPNTAGFKVFRE